ncbi:unnamed protein product [Caretta caretta]
MHSFYAHSWLCGDSLYCTWEHKLQPSEALEVGRKDDCEVSGVSFAPFLSLTLISAVFFVFFFITSSFLGKAKTQAVIPSGYISFHFPVKHWSSKCAKHKL